MLAIDYTKAFDSVDFGYIHKMLHIFNFGENLRNCISILYTRGTSCVTNNGFRIEFLTFVIIKILQSTLLPKLIIFPK